MRYRPQFEWNPNSWTYNMFRVFELIFGRKYGIRAEASASVDRNGRVEYQFYTLEAAVVHMEGVIRKFFKSWKIVPVEVWIPVLAPANMGFNIPRNRFVYLAIAFDTATTSLQSGASPKTISYTVTGSDAFVSFGAATDGQEITSATYAGAAMTFGADMVTGDKNVYYKVASATGTNDLVITGAGGSIYANVLSHSGVGSVESVTQGAGGTGTDMTQTVTPSGSNAWGILYTECNNNVGASSGTNCTRRSGNTNVAHGDTNGTISGATAMHLTAASDSGGWFSAAAVILPPAASGPANLKSLDTNLKANIKSINTNLIANVKSFDTNV